MNAEAKKWLDNAIKKAEPEQQLRNLVEELKKENWSQLEVYDLFESYLFFLQEQDREAEEDIVANVVGDIWGWCPASARLFPRKLSNEEFYQYKLSKRSKSEE